MANETVRPCVWRDNNNNNQHVDSAVGRDDQTTGNLASPFKTLNGFTKARGAVTAYIRGFFSEECKNSSDNHVVGNYYGVTLFGDYPGAAIFDGDNDLRKDFPCGYGLEKMIVRNIPTKHPGDIGYASYAGLGRAYYNGGSSVGSVTYVYGLAGSSNVCKNTCMYMGACGENAGATVQKSVFDAPLPCHGGDNSNVHYGPITVIARGQTVDDSNKNNTFINRPEIAMRRKQLTSITDCCINRGLFANWAMIANEKFATTIYKECLFAADAVWYFLEGTNELGESWDAVTGKKFDMRTDAAGATTSAERQAALESWMRDTCGMTALPTFNNCVFSDKTIDEILNGQAVGDYSPKMNSGADLGHGEYIGAFPPSKNILFIDHTENDSNGSEGMPETWDETTKGGCLSINPDTHELEIDDTSEARYGEIYSKIIKLDIFTEQVNKIVAAFNHQWRNRCAVALMPTYERGDGVTAYGSVFGEAYGASDELISGRRYYVHGKIMYNGTPYQTGDIIEVASGNPLTFDELGTNSTMNALNEHNILDVVYCRCREKIYAYVTPSDTLQAGGVYYNCGNKNVTYHGRTVVPGESFIAKSGDLVFTCADDALYQVAVMFDDTRVPATAPWCPAAMLDEYYVRKNAGSIMSDSFGQPYSSGNPRAYNTTGAKSTIDRTYSQFAIFVQRPYNIKAEADAENE